MVVNINSKRRQMGVSTKPTKKTKDNSTNLQSVESLDDGMIITVIRQQSDKIIFS